MAYRVTWIEHGVLAPEQEMGNEPMDRLHARRFEQGAVRVVSGPKGTEIKWMVEAPCTGSLLRAVLHIADAPAPYVLRYHLIGWFEEVFFEAYMAIRRMEEVLSRGDRYFPSRAFVREGSPQGTSVPAVIRESMINRSAPADFTVECVRERNGPSYLVDKVGPRSAIGRVWGTVTSSYPCQPTSRYGDAISAAYDEVLQTGQPRYQQVLAALRMPDNQIHWVPYHRAIFPLRKRSEPSVAVLSQIAEVDIKVI